MANVLHVKAGGGGAAGDQTELLSKGRGGSLEPDEAASSFLALEEGSEASGGGGAGRRGGRAGGAACSCRMAGGRVPALVLALALVAIAAAALALAIELSREVDALRRDVDDLKQRVHEQDIYSKLRAFEDAVYEDEADDENSASDGDDAEDEDGLPPEDDDDVDYYPDDEAVDEDDSEQEPEAEKAATPGPEHRGRFHPQYEHMQRPHGAARSHKKPGTEPVAAERAAAAEAVAEAAAAAAQEKHGSARHKREISDKAPEVEENLNFRTNTSEGLRLYGMLVGHDSPAPLPSSRLNSVRSRPASRRSGKENRDTTAAAARRELDGGAVAARARLQHAPPGASTPFETPSVIQRQWRVMQTPTPAPPPVPPRTRALPAPPSRFQFHSAHSAETRPPADGEKVVRVYQDQREAAFLRSAAAPRLKKKSAAKKTLSGALRDGQEDAAARGSHALRRRPVFAAHYGGDASSYALGSTSHFEGNGKLRHPNKLFVDWSPSAWVNQLSMDKKFSLRDGAVTVTDSGLYFVYAQIHYLDQHDTNGYEVLLNNEPVLQCTVTAGQPTSGPNEPRSNTCFTAGAMYLAPGDRVTVREVGALRWTLFQPQKSFFGLVKLGHTARIT